MTRGAAAVDAESARFATGSGATPAATTDLGYRAGFAVGGAVDARGGAGLVVVWPARIAGP